MRILARSCVWPIASAIHVQMRLYIFLHTYVYTYIRAYAYIYAYAHLFSISHKVFVHMDQLFIENAFHCFKHWIYPKVIIDLFAYPTRQGFYYN
jgi:hypothetical protein